MTKTPDPVPIRSEGRGYAFSFVWLVPIAALAVALGAAWRNYSQRGPIITVTFGNAAGVTPDETALRFRDITVGLVEEVGFSEDLDRVEVMIRLDQEIAPYVDEEARFWVVRPEVTAQGVTGLDTVLSGVYIQGAWDGTIGPPAETFEGFDTAPLLRAGEEGVPFLLRSDEGLPAAETPILFKGVPVGRIAGAEIMPDGLTAQSDAVIFAPYDTLVTSSSRFWDISGFELSLGAEGAALDFTSLSSLISGGVTFETLGSGGRPLSEGMVFELHPDAEAAREDFFLEGEGSAVEMMMVFDDNMAGLRAGAPVELGGLRIGEVVTISGLVDPERFGDSDARLLATMRINPARIGLQDDADQEALIDFLNTRAADGLRGRLTNASLLTGGLKVELVEIPGAPPAQVDVTAEPYPAIPTAPAAVTNVAASAQGLLSRVDALPVEELMENAIGLMTDARAVIGSDEVRALPAEVSDILEQLQSASARVDGLLETLEQEQAAQALVGAIETLSGTADALPPLVDEARSVLETVRTLPLEDLVTQVNDVLTAAETLLSSDDTRAIPEAVTAALDELQGTLSAIRAIADAAETQALPGEAQALLAELQSASGRIDTLLAQVEEQDTVGAVTAAVRDVADAASGLPALTEEARALLADARALPLEDIVTRADGLLNAAEALLASDATRAIPAEVNAALTEVQATLAAVRRIAQSEETQSLPGEAQALLDRLQSASGRIDGLLAQIEEQDTVGTVTAAVRDLGDAASGLPALSEQARALLEEARALPLQDLVRRAEAVLASADTLISAESTRAVPAEVNAALAELRQTLASVRAITSDPQTQALPGQVSALTTDLQDAAARLDALLADAQERDVVGSVIAAVEDVEQAAAGLPELTTQANALLRSARALPLDALTQRASTLIASANSILGQDSARDIPAELNGALASLRETLETLQEGGLVENANATLISAREAAEALAEASATLPDLAARLGAVADQAGTTLEGYNRNSQFSRDLQGAIRQVESAAEAIDRLARQISRNPSSLIQGR
ncbi:MlaD family protein [Citreimonas salinaria]|uniref:Paraquat-inducible protein B n=1 Tax=Citreimonas salinaria TaxID=321339 RepID=A0A1H3H4F6_9RHOB|nr:MlaD family protein [Citreimonas salinaria]SDY10277.1 Paraquat-inducible protein B [Citreimonas salinaria]